MSDEQKILVEVYNTYSDAKEKFIDRNFATNRYYLGLTIFLLLIALIIYALTPSLVLMTVVGAIGVVTSTLWWLNLDSYQFLIKIKYANVLERIEDNLPVKPYQEEYKATQEMKKKKNAIVFADLQKGFAFLILLIFLVIFLINIARSVTVNTDFGAPAPVTEEIQTIPETVDIPTEE